jgi:hypothetical protein
LDSYHLKVLELFIGELKKDWVNESAEPNPMRVTGIGSPLIKPSPDRESTSWQP